MDVKRRDKKGLGLLVGRSKGDERFGLYIFF